ALAPLPHPSRDPTGPDDPVPPPQQAIRNYLNGREILTITLEGGIVEPSTAKLNTDGPTTVEINAIEQSIVEESRNQKVAHVSVGHRPVAANGHLNGHSNGHATHVSNGHSTGHTNDHLNGHQNRDSKPTEQIKQHRSLNGVANGHQPPNNLNGHVNGQAKQPADGSPNDDVNHRHGTEAHADRYTSKHLTDYLKAYLNNHNDLPDERQNGRENHRENSQKSGKENGQKNSIVNDWSNSRANRQAVEQGTPQPSSPLSTNGHRPTYEPSYNPNHQPSNSYTFNSASKPQNSHRASRPHTILKKNHHAGVNPAGVKYPPGTSPMTYNQNRDTLVSNVFENAVPWEWFGIGQTESDWSDLFYSINLRRNSAVTLR
ncbi:MAG: hypothetical protein AAF639_42445, partial [Chloroflexota bacterium]